MYFSFVMTIIALNFWTSYPLSYSEFNSNVSKKVDPVRSIFGSYFSLLGIDTFLEGFAEDVLNETSQCNKEIKILYNSSIYLEQWALKMLDATAKPQSGILSGNFFHVGNYDECLSIDTRINETIHIKGRYCTSLYSQNGTKQPLDFLLENGDEIMKLRMSYGFCIPQSCRASDLEKIAQNIKSSLNSPMHFFFYDELCSSVNESTQLIWSDFLALSIFSVLGILIVFSTGYDVLVSKGVNESAKSRLYTAFSFYTNSKKLFFAKSSSESIKCLNGIKVLSLAWIILSHRYMYTLYVPLINYADILEMLKTYPIALVLTGSLAVDSFFLVTGLLIVYLFLVNQSNGRKVSWFMFYCHRILRLTPSLAAMVLVYATIFDNIGAGPFWFLIHHIFQRFCIEKWWSTLLYVQNYVNPNDICVGQSWYLAVDTQLYFLSPIILFGFVKVPAIAIGGMLALVLVTDGYAFMTSYVHELSPAFFGSEKAMFKLVYVPTHARCSPWLIGAILGYILFKMKHRKIKMNVICTLLCWAATIAVLLAIVHIHKILATDNVDKFLENALYNSMIRTLWSFVLGIIILLCATGNGGIVNDILSWGIFVVLSKLCYSMYLVQLLVIISSTAQIRTPEYLSHMLKVKQFFGDFFTIFCISVIWFLTFESPVAQFESIIFKRKKPSEDEVLRNGNNIQMKAKDDNASTKIS